MMCNYLCEAIALISLMEHARLPDVNASFQFSLSVEKQPFPDYIDTVALRQIDDLLGLQIVSQRVEHTQLQPFKGYERS